MAKTRDANQIGDSITIRSVPTVAWDTRVQKLLSRLNSLRYSHTEWANFRVPAKPAHLSIAAGDEAIQTAGYFCLAGIIHHLASH